MPPTTKPETICYSPRPRSEYKTLLPGRSEPVGPAVSKLLVTDEAWNLAYLSHDFEKSLYHDDPKFTTHVRFTLDHLLDRKEIDLAQEYADTRKVRAWFRLPAPRAVKLLEGFQYLTNLPLYQAYGVQWLDTIRERSRIVVSDPEPKDYILDFSDASSVIARWRL